MDLLLGTLVVVAIAVVLRLHASRLCRESRSVLLRVPVEHAWESVRNFGVLQMRHGRGRPLLNVESSELIRGDGASPGSVWRQRGVWGSDPWWAEIELVAIEPPHRIEVRLLRDAFGTHNGLPRHRCIIELVAEGPRATKLTFSMKARIQGLRLVLARTFSPERVHARLLDLGLRSLKIEIDGVARAESETGMATDVRSPLPFPALAAGIQADGRPAASPSAPFLRDRV